MNINALDWKINKLDYHEAYYYGYLILDGGDGEFAPTKGVSVLIGGEYVPCEDIEDAIYRIQDEVCDKLYDKLNKLADEYDNYYDFETDVYNNDIYIVDHSEEFYYDRPFFDDIFDKVVKLVREVCGQEYSIECECPGRWVVFK